MKRKLFLLLCALLTSVGMWANQTLADNGVYYIQNVETGLFLSRGGSFGAHALADNYGLAWRLTGTNGSITLQMYDIYCEGFTTGGLGGDSYVDNGSPLSNWTLEGDANGYTIKTGSTFLTASGNAPGSDVVINGDGTGNKTWILLSDAEHAAVLAAKTSAQESAIATTAGIDLGTSTLSEVIGNTSNWRTSTIAVAAPTSSDVWTYTENRDQGGANNYGDYGTELYNKSGKFTKTISDLENGIYKITVRAMHRSTYCAPCWTVGESFTNHTNSYVLANGYYAQLKDWKSAAEKDGDTYKPDGGSGTADFKTKVEAGYYATDVFAYVSDGTLDLTIAQEGFWYGEWFAFNGVTLTYYSDQVTDEDATAILATATDVLDKAMLKATKDALSDAKNTFDGARTIANYNVLNTAIGNANASVATYAPLGTKLSEAASVRSDVSSYSPSYITTFDTNIGAITSNYNAGNYAESAISTQVAAVEAEIVTLVKSQTVAGSDMTRAVPNAACTGAAGDDNWKIKNVLADGEYFRLDTWAGTASGMSVPMVEYWIYNGTPLSSNEMYQTITGLSNGVYRVTATTAVNNESSVAPNDGSALLFANDATTDITTGGTKTSFNGQTGTFTVEGVVSDGSLTLGLKAVSPNYNWIAFKDVHLTLVNLTVSATIGDTGWTTFASAYPLDLSKMTASEGDVKAYYASSQSGSNIVMTSTDQTVAAGTGLMLKGTAGATVTIPVVASGDAISGNMLVGCPSGETLTANANYYVLIKNGETAEFQSLKNSGATIPAGKAYLNTGILSPARLIISFEEDPTAINAVEAAEAECGALKDGKYIIDNKVVIVKNGVKYSANGQILK